MKKGKFLFFGLIFLMLVGGLALIVGCDNKEDTSYKCSADYQCYRSDTGRTQCSKVLCSVNQTTANISYCDCIR